MPTEVYANQAETTLAANIASGDLTLTVASSAAFPAVTTASHQQFRIRVEPAVPDGVTREWMTVTNVAGTTWTVARGQEGSAALGWLAGARITAVLVVGNIIPKGRAAIVFENATDDYFIDLQINEDASPSAGWRDRLRASYRTLLGVTSLVQWWNEYFELRLMPAKNNTVALRIFVKNDPADPAHTGMVLEITDNRTDRNTIAGFDSLGNVIAVNLGPQNYVNSVAPADHTKVWIDLSV